MDTDDDDNELLTSDDPQAEQAGKGFRQLGSALGRALSDPKMENFPDPTQPETPLQTPLLDPIDFVGGAIGSKLGGALARDAASIVGNEIGAVGRNVKGAAKKSPKPLAMDEASRMARAEKMGFDPNKTYYHGTKADFDQFKVTEGGNGAAYGKGLYFTERPSEASDYAMGFVRSSNESRAGANVIPAHLKMEKPFNLDSNIDPELKEYAIKHKLISKSQAEKVNDNFSLYGYMINKMSPSKFTETLQKFGYDGLQAPHVKTTVVFEPHQVRSKFAEFDPKKAKKGGLSFAHGGIAGTPIAHYASGGSVDTFDPQEYLASKGIGGPQATSAVPVDPLQLSQFNPDAYLRDKEIEGYNQLQSKYGTGDQQAIAALEGAARGATLGWSDFVARELTSAEAVEGRKLANPATAMGTNIAGTAASLGLTGGMAPIIGKMAVRAGMRTGIARALAVGTEGAAISSGNIVSEYLLGDPNLNAQKVMTELGLGFALGAGLGAFSKTLHRAPSFLRGLGKEKAAVAETDALAALKPVDSALDSTTPSGIVDLPLSTPPAKSLEELEKQLSDYKKFAGQEGLFDLPQKPIAQSAAKAVELDMPIPITQIQLDSLNGQMERRAFKHMAELPGKEGDTFRNVIVAQKKSLNSILDHTIDKIAPDYVPTTNAVEAGQRVSDTLTKQIEGIRQEIGPAIGELKQTPIQQMDHVPGVVEYLTNPEKSTFANPKIAKMFNTKEGNLTLKPHDTGMGVTEAAYRAIGDAIDGLKKNPNDFETLFDVRKSLDEKIDITKLGDAAKEIGSAKAAMMDYIQDLVQTLSPDVRVRELFKKYAINESNAEFIERTIGARIGDNWRSLAINKPEEAILRKIFSNSAMTKAVKEIMSPDEFQKVLADYMKITKNDFVDTGVFSANRFMSRIGKGSDKYALDEAFIDNPASYQKIKDVITTMRAFTDDMPENPSGTAKTLLSGLLGVAKQFPHPIKMIEGLVEVGKEKLGNVKLRADINAKLAGETDKQAKLGVINRMINQVDKRIQQGSKAIFATKERRGVSRTLILATAAQALHSEDSYERNVEKIKKFSSNPQGLMDHVADNTEHLYEAAPGITQVLHTQIMNAVQFLSTKIPHPPTNLPLSPEWQPNQAQKNQFNKYFHAVNHPIESLNQVKNGTLTNETMEALNAVHPGVLQQMRQEVLSHYNPEKARQLPYAQKIALSKFLGQTLDSNLLPQAIQSNQMALNANLSDQSAPKEGRKVNQGGLGKIKLSTRTATRSERSAEQE